MKVTDLGQIQQMATDIIAENGSALLDFLTLQEAINVLVTIYVTNDQCSGVGQDFDNNLSIVSSLHRVGIIFQRHVGIYVSETSLCGYDDLSVDISYINMCIDAAIAKWDAAQ